MVRTTIARCVKGIFYSSEPRCSVDSSPSCGPHGLITATFVGYQATNISGAFTNGWPYVFLATFLLALWSRYIRS